MRKSDFKQPLFIHIFELHFLAKAEAVPSEQHIALSRGHVWRVNKVSSCAPRPEVSGLTFDLALYKKRLFPAYVCGSFLGLWDLCETSHFQMEKGPLKIQQLAVIKAGSSLAQWGC